MGIRPASVDGVLCRGEPQMQVERDDPGWMIERWEARETRVGE